jgi:segregation and condensation protein A
LQIREVEQENIFPRLPVKPDFATAAPAKAEATLFDLINAVNEVLKRVGKREDLREIFEDKWSVSEKIEFIVKLIATRDSVKFSELFSGATSRSEVVCTFLAMLELIRMRQLSCAQSEDFGEIEIIKAPSPAASAEMNAA